MKWNSSKSITFSKQHFLGFMCCSSVRNAEIKEVIAYFTAMLSSRRERERGWFAYCPHRHDAWRCIFAGSQAIPTHQKSSQKRALLFFCANGFLPFQEMLCHSLLMPLLEDPKMELKTFLLPLRLGLLTAFHQSAEVNIFTIKVFPFVSS